LLCTLALSPLAGVMPALGAEAPKWLHALAAAPLPSYDDRTAAVQLYSETSITVQPSGKIQRFERKALKILHPNGVQRGILAFGVNPMTRVTDLQAWCIPTTGKDYAVRQRDAVRVGLSGVVNGLLAADVGLLALQVPAAAPGSVIGYEVQTEETLDALADDWRFQDTVPVRQASYSLKLPGGWGYKAAWLNHSEQSPTNAGANQWLWTLNDIAAVRVEPSMPPLIGMEGNMYVTLIPPAGAKRSLQTWSDMGGWYSDLARGRSDPSPQLKQKVAELTASASNLLEKIRALATFVQQDIRYVGIELGIGGYQPHAATEVLNHEYGDCKDKATLLGAMLEQIGIASYPVIINAQRGAVQASTPPTLYAFNHMILALALPADVQDPRLQPIYAHANLGNLLFFDPTNEVIPFGALSGSLQGNYGLLVGPQGGELVRLPVLAATANGISRTATLTLDESGTLRGEIREIRLGDRAAEERHRMRDAKAESDRIKPIERLLSSSLSAYQITNAGMVRSRPADDGFEWHYSIEVEHYAKAAGDITVLRPRVLGSEARDLLETREPREHSVEFDAAERDTDVFEIALPGGLSVESLPAPVDINEGFAAYHSKTELIGRTLRYTRTLQIDQPSIPVERVDDLRAFYRAVSTDERNEAVLKHLP
jgi:hypothetical protein